MTSYPESAGMGAITAVLKWAWVVVTVLATLLLLFIGYAVPGPEGYIWISMGLFTSMLLLIPILAPTHFHLRGGGY